MQHIGQQQKKVYNSNDCCIFRKTKELFGGFSNMASGYPIKVNGINILTTEALFQACKFPDSPEIQQIILSEKSPMAAKMAVQLHRDRIRPDWYEVNIKVMKWCLRLKLAQNFILFGRLFETTGDKPIVEESTKDDFWGTIRRRDDEILLEGVNAQGRLLMELRQFYNENRFAYNMFVIEPLDIPNFKLLEREIEISDCRSEFILDLKTSLRLHDLEMQSNLAVNTDNKIVQRSNIQTINKSIKRNKSAKNSNSGNLPDQGTFF